MKELTPPRSVTPHAEMGGVWDHAALGFFWLISRVEEAECEHERLCGRQQGGGDRPEEEKPG